MRKIPRDFILMMRLIGRAKHAGTIDVVDAGKLLRTAVGMYRVEG